MNKRQDRKFVTAGFYENPRNIRQGVLVYEEEDFCIVVGIGETWKCSTDYVEVESYSLFGTAKDLYEALTL